MNKEAKVVLVSGGNPQVKAADLARQVIKGNDVAISVGGKDITGLTSIDIPINEKPEKPAKISGGAVASSFTGSMIVSLKKMVKNTPLYRDLCKGDAIMKAALNRYRYYSLGGFSPAYEFKIAMLHGLPSSVYGKSGVDKRRLKRYLRKQGVSKSRAKTVINVACGKPS